MLKKYKSCVVGALSLGWLAVNPSVQAQWSNDPSENTLINLGGQTPQIISDGNGGAIITSIGYGGWEESLNIYIQRIDRFGNLRWGDINTATISATNNQILDDPRQLLSDGNGGAYLAWTDYRRSVYPPENPMDSADVYIQHVDGNGVMLWQDDGIKVVLSATDRMYPKIVSDGEGGIIAVFYGAFYTDETYYAQRLSHNGDRIWGPNGITILSDISMHEFDIAPDGEGGIYFVYNLAGNNHIQRINGFGEILWDSTGIRTSIGTATVQSFPVVISDSLQNAIVQFRGSYWDGTTTIFQLILQKISPAGARQWGDEGIIVSDQITDQLFPHKMVIGENNGVYVGWFDGQPTWAPSFVRYFDRSGVEGIMWNGNGDRGPLLLCSDKEGGVIFKYAVRDEQDSSYSYVQRLSHDIQTMWDSEGVLFTTHSGRHTQVGVSDGNGGVIITWYEIGLGTGQGVYAQQINQNGQLGEVILAIPNTDSIQPGTFTLLPNYPNPFNQGTNIQYYLPSKNHIVLNIYSLNGQKVITLVDEYINPGMHKVFWNGKNEFGINAASGVYLVNYITGDKSISQKISMLK